MDFNRTLYAIATFRTSEGAIQEALASTMPGREDGPADAYRHILLAAELTRRFGEDRAQVILDAHETTGNLGGQSPAAEAMDKRNNEIGVELGRGASSWNDVVSRARGEFSDTGRATWLPPSQWKLNPLDGSNNRIPTGDPRLNWPVRWPVDGKPFPQVNYSPESGNYVDKPFDPFVGLKSLSPGIYLAIQAGLAWYLRRDPLILDLDGDGIELTASSSSVLFDHNADGLKTGSQWAKADDGMLVRDLNGNGLIDSGRELFGDQTMLPNGSLAINGFQALAALDKDANGIADGVFDANDVAYSELKVWRDLNQDGVSQSNELLGLAESGVSAINLVQTPTQTAQGKSTFTKTVSGVDTNGNPVTTTSTQTVQNVNLTSNTFYRAFSDDPAITPQAAQLPQMQGAGLVRDLREAMSLGTVQSTALQTSLEVFKGATSAKARQSQADAIVQAWANTSGLPDALARNPILPASAGLANWYVSSPGQAIANFAQSNPALYQQLTLLERFNGQAILERYAHLVAANYYDPAQHRYFGYTYYAVSIEGQRLAFFQSAYDSLKASTYQSLYLQTAGKALLDQVELVIDDKGLRLGFDEPELKRRCIRSGKSFATKKVVVNVSFTVTKCRFIQPKRVPKGLWRNFAGLNCSNLNSSQNLNTEIFDTFVQTGCATSKFA